MIIWKNEDNNNGIIDVDNNNQYEMKKANSEKWQ